MQICKNCYSLMTPIPTFIENNRKWEVTQSSFILCCESPSPIEIEDGELEIYEENWESLDLEDLTEKEEVILNYLAKEARIDYTKDKPLEFTDDKQLWFDIL